MKFTDIEKFPRSYYTVNVDLSYLKEHFEHWSKDGMLIMEPEWQRGHVWNKKQKSSYMEYFLKGGTTGRNIYFNCSSWMGNFNTPIYCVDGLQRITAALDFLDNKIPAFGYLFKEFEDRLRMVDVQFIFHMLKIRSKRELLNVYIDMNSGGTPHNPKEIKRIEKMLEETPENENI